MSLKSQLCWANIAETDTHVAQTTISYWLTGRKWMNTRKWVSLKRPNGFSGFSCKWHKMWNISWVCPSLAAVAWQRWLSLITEKPLSGCVTDGWSLMSMMLLYTVTYEKRLSVRALLMIWYKHQPFIYCSIYNNVKLIKWAFFRFWYTHLTSIHPSSTMYWKSCCRRSNSRTEICFQ